ncbi:MAG: hypothetical protein UFG06_14005 [Lachnospiraceae bacterium]|nr:hypothetical protein [Lachnospiraceae bacterium]
MKKIMNPKEMAKISKRRSQYEEAKIAYSNDLSEMTENEALYNGTRNVQGNPNKPWKSPTKVAINVRNIVYELIESQVDAAIPMPKVSPIHEEDASLAKIIEDALANEIRLINFNEINDKQERTVPIQGGDYMHVEWDNKKGFHCNVGGLSVSERHPRCVIPQPGVTEVQDMDYIFVVISMTRDDVKRKYGVEVEGAAETEREIRTDNKTNTDLVSVIKQYYRNKDGGIGLFTWCDDYILEDMEDYQSRRLERCKKCGRVKYGDECECGSRSFEYVKEEYEELTEDIQQYNNNVIPSISGYERKFALDKNGDGLIDKNGIPVMEEVAVRTRIPYYKPDCFPLVLRRNVSRSGRLLGFSDVSVIKDQQDAVKKLGSKIQEKILGGGSILTLPEGLPIRMTDEDYRVVRVRNAADLQAITVRNLQVDISGDLRLLEYNYDWAKSGLGITDAYQGKYDSSATSGTAKQYSINQAAGRLESKRVMKNAAYAKLYEMMFKFLLAYADQPIPISKKRENGEYSFSHFNRYDFLKQDAAGDWYWNDEFIIETDPTSTIMMNREAMWQQADFKLQSGAFGPVGETRSLLLYWEFMQKNDYPNAAEIKRKVEEKYNEEQQQMQLMQQLTAQQGGGNSEMPVM